MRTAWPPPLAGLRRGLTLASLRTGFGGFLTSGFGFGLGLRTGFASAAGSGGKAATSSGGGGGGSRHAPERERTEPQFILKTRKALGPDPQELAENPRSRSAKLRVGIRTGAPAGHTDRKAIGMPVLRGGH